MRGSGTVVVVDPDELGRQSYEVALARVGYRVVSAGDGRSGLRLATRMLPETVVTELVLPAMDGFCLARRLRRQEATRHIGIVALTAYDGDDLGRRAAECGIDAIVRKPGSPHDLIHSVRETTRRSRESIRHCEDPRGVVVHKEVERSRRLMRSARQEMRVTTQEQVGDETVNDGMIGEADGARDVMILDPERGELLFTALFERYEEHPVLYFRRGEAYRAIGRRKLAHADFSMAAARMSQGAWRERMRLAAMRTRSPHDKTNK